MRTCSTEDRQASLSDASEPGVVRQRLGQLVAEVPAQAELIGAELNQLAVRADAFKRT